MALGWITLPLIFHQIYPSPWWRITKVHLKTILPCLKSLEGFLAAHRTVWPWQMRSPGSVSLKQYFHEFPSITLNFQDFLRCSLFYSYMILLKCGCVKVAQSCPTLCDPMDYTVQGILQARILECVAVPFSSESSWSGIEPESPALQMDYLPAELAGKPSSLTEKGPLS